MDDRGFVDWIGGELATLPGVVAVALGGSRARGGPEPDSDWDLAVYYRQHFESDALRARGWPGEVSDVGGWGGGVMSGGAWLTIDDRRVDVHYRDLNDVEHWCAEANGGRFHKELLLIYAAGIPTYVLMAELALKVTLSGVLPRPSYPDALARKAGRRWAVDAVASLRYGEAAVRSRGDVVVGLANGARGLIEAAHGRLAASGSSTRSRSSSVPSSKKRSECSSTPQAQSIWNWHCVPCGIRWKHNPTASDNDADID